MNENKPQHGDRVQIEVNVQKFERDTDGTYHIESGESSEIKLLTASGDTEDVTRIQEGRTYRIRSALVYIPEEDPRRHYTRLREIAEKKECPSCQGSLNFDATEGYLEDVDIDEVGQGRHYLVTSETNINEISGSDDWIPMPESGQTTQKEDPSAVIECKECGFVVRWKSGVDPEKVAQKIESGEVNKLSGMTEVFQNNEVELHQPLDSSESVGMATGGSKDAESFRENIHEGYTPQKDALSYEGLFYDYYFNVDNDNEGEEDTEGLFYPTYSTAVSENPINGEKEKYLSVGLNSNLTKDEFGRKKLNLVVALDISGSMSSEFKDYYYDESGTRREKKDSDDEHKEVSKMEAARESLANLTHHLNEDDSFGVVLYNSNTHVAKPLNPVDETDMNAIRGHIREVTSGGGTDMVGGFDEGVDMLTSKTDADPQEVENRVVFMTDAMPNTGVTGRESIVDRIEDAADDGIYTTFMGIGIDANQDLIDSLSAVRGANHYFVHSVSEFEQRLDEEFEYMVTPLAFDLSLKVESSEYEIADVYGSPGEGIEDGEVMKVSTLFPSPKKEGETRGGVVLLKLERLEDAKSDTGKVGLEASWEERDGTEGSKLVQVSVPSEPGFSNEGIRKAVLLARYGSVMRDWIDEVRENESERDETEDSGEDDWVERDRKRRRRKTKWEQEATPIAVPEGYRNKIEAVKTYLEAEMEVLGDTELEQEVEVIERVLE